MKIPTKKRSDSFERRGRRDALEEENGEDEEDEVPRARAHFVVAVTNNQVAESGRRHTLKVAS